MGEGKGGGRRGSRSNGKVVAEGRELELVGGAVHNAGQRGRRAEEHGGRDLQTGGMQSRRRGSN